MNCWSCGATGSLPLGGKLSFRATCDSCGRDLHCCRQCAYYAPGKSNNCSVPGTDWVADREKNNFCDEFSPSKTQQKAPSDQGKKRVEDLFL